MNDSNKITGIIDHIEEKSGTSQSGTDWRSRVLVIREVSGQYPQSAAIDAFGDKADHVQVGDLVDCYFNLKARPYNEKWFTNISAWRVEKYGAQAPVAVPEDVPTQEEASKAAGLAPEAEDLPF